MTTDVLVQGGGLLGLALVGELERRGVAVRCVDWPQPGRASTVAAGMLVPQIEAQAPGAQFELWRRAGQHYADDLRRLDPSPEAAFGFRACGALLPASTPSEQEALLRRFAWQLGAGLPIELLDGEGVRQRVPELGPRLGGVWLPASGQVEPARLHARLTEIYQEKGLLEIYEKEPRIEVREDGVWLDGYRRAERVVLAEGAWHRRVGGEAATAQGPVRPVRGQLLELALSTPTRPAVVYGEGGYLVARGDGRFVIGSTSEEVGFDASTTEEARQQLLGRAVRLWPALAEARLIRHTAGLRPGSADGLPLVGPLPSPLEATAARARRFVLGGAFRNGILLAFELARLMANLLEGHPSDEQRAFFPDRLTGP